MEERIPFQVDISRVIEVLAKQIYQSPLALLRENVQNAYDAVLIRRQSDPAFEPRIDVRISPDEIRVSDNGIGMTADDLRNHYWRAGSSSKNNPIARAAGVVGTFGIGAMANFGIASELTVITEDMQTGQRTLSRARRDTLSATEGCIDLISQASVGKPGTEIIAKILSQHHVNVNDATRYITDFVSCLQVPVHVIGALVSQRPFEQAVPQPPEAWRVSRTAERIGARLVADIDLIGAPTGDMWLSLHDVQWDGGPLPGRMILRQGTSAVKTYRSGFGLATTSVLSVYQFGGVADFLFLEPTAGREALATSSMQTLQAMISELDEYCSRQIATRPESDANTAFMAWVTQRGHYDLCGNLKIRIEPGGSMRLHEVAERTRTVPMLSYSGTDKSIIAHHASEDTPLLLVAQSHPRRQCELEFLRRHCQIEEISDSPAVLFEKSATEWSLSESALAFRIASLLETDYFLKGRVTFGGITHGLPMLVQRSGESVIITLDPVGATVSLILSLYERDFLAFGSLVKDFVRNAIFPKVSDFVPSSTRQGAEAFLKTIRRSRELFEYEISDLGDLPSIWQDVIEGRLTIEQATEKSITIARASVQIVDSLGAVRITEVVPDVVTNEAVLSQTMQPGESDELAPAPAVTRLDRSTAAKLLLIDDNESALRGYRCFLAITDRVREEHSAFFLQPHKTSVVWGGQRALFIFQHHSGRFGLYYDLQTSEMIAPDSGGGAYPSYTIMLKNALFIPIPEPIRGSFIPKGNERKRFEIRCDILYTAGGENGQQ